MEFVRTKHYRVEQNQQANTHKQTIVPKREKLRNKSNYIHLDNKTVHTQGTSWRERRNKWKKKKPKENREHISKARHTYTKSR